MFLSDDEAKRLTDLLTKTFSSEEFSKKTKELKSSLEREKLESGFSLSKSEVSGLYDFLSWETFSTDIEEDICLNILKDIPLRFWSSYGVPKEHKETEFCNCRFCLLSSYRKL